MTGHTHAGQDVNALQSELARTRAALAASEARLTHLASVSGHWYWETDALSRFVWMSDSVEHIVGVPPVWHYGRSRWELAALTQDLTAEPWKSHKAAIEREEPFANFRYLRRGPNGDQWLSTSGAPFYDQTGRFLGFRGVARDVTVEVTEAKKAQAANELLAAAIENLDETIVLCDAQDRIVLANRRFRDISTRSLAPYVAPGTPYEIYLRASVAQGHIPQAAGREEAWVAERLVQRSRSSVNEYLRNGVWLRLLDHRLPDGSVITIGVDISARKHAELALRASERQLRTIVDNMPAIIVQVSYAGGERRYSFTNQTYCQTLGRSADQIVGHTVAEVVGDEMYPLIGRMIDRVQAGERIQYERRLGEQYLSWEMVPDRDERGNVIGHYGIGLDVTQQRVAAEHLAAAKLAAEDANRAKSQFLATMSHEIRTPMNGVLGMTELLLGTQLDDRQRDFAATIQRSGATLLGIINDILDFAKIETGRLALEEVAVALPELLGEVTTLMRDAARAKDLSLESRIADEVPRLVLGDPLRLRQILTNLLSNAVKFTEQGAVSVEIDLAPAELLEPVAAPEGPSIGLRFRVRDTGIGLARETLDKMFAAFTQADGSTTRRFGGTGLGLAICRQLTDLMGGAIGADSEPGHGSIFWFVLRMKPAPAPGPLLEVDRPPAQAVRTRSNGRREQTGCSVASEASAAAAAEGKALRVLLAEDNRVNREIAVNMLKSLGCDVMWAANGKEASDYALDGPYDMVLMDCQMPVMDGLEATAKIRERELHARENGNEGSHIPIIALTANAMKGDRERCLAAGMDDYIAKPFTKSQLRETIERWARCRTAP